MNLDELPNIGPGLARRLASVGIKPAEEFKTTGARQAFISLNAMDSTTCINTLFALEGAVQGIRWHQLPVSEKNELTEFFRMVKTSGSSHK